jgi:TolB-like protein
MVLRVPLTAATRVGPYEVVSLLGTGGMAEVYRARDTRLGREVAVKVMSEALGGDGPLRERFEREAKLAGSLNHPNIVALYDVGFQDGKPYFVTELLEGQTLRERLAQGPIPVAKALEWAGQMAQALAAAHERGIVHRDLKPENIFVTRDGQVKLLDFGIAKLVEAVNQGAPHGLLDSTVASAGSTGTGMVLGTPGYMSPEQVRGDAVDARTDFFSLGAVLYEMLSGKRAFPAGSVVESGYAILHNEVEALPASVPGPVAQVVGRCLEKDAGRRFHSARDLAFHLELLRTPTGLATAAMPPGSLQRGRGRWLLAIPVAVFLIVLGLRFGPPLLAKRGGATADMGPKAGNATPSIAVLPFVNLSSDKEQEYFSDGISEELLDALAKVKGLRVAGRTSSFHFKGKNEDLRTIAETLGVANILEGSVRKQGNRVRITAQLIQASDGFHLWSNTFEGELTDVFELQERIARAITDQLKVVLQGDQRTRLVPVATSNPEAYALYLQATAIFNRRDGKRFLDGIEMLEQAIRLDPGYARAWSRLATLKVLLPVYVVREFKSAPLAAEQAAERAIALDPSLAEPYAVLGLVRFSRREFLAGRDAFHHALELEPDDVTANLWSGTSLLNTGYVARGTQVLDRLLTIDPILPNALLWRGLAAFDQGDTAMAERLLVRAQDLGLAHVGVGLALTADARGDKPEAVRQMTRAFEVFGTELPQGSAETIARGMFGDEQTRAKAVALLEAYVAKKPEVMSGAVAYALLKLGDTARALEVIAAGPTSNDAVAFYQVWGPSGHSARASPMFPDFLRRTGMADLWEREGTPDMCHRLGPRDYVCK